MNTDRLVALFRQQFGHAPDFIAQAPGRVNLLGEHVDYNDGFVLPAAIDRATYIAFSPAAADTTVLWAADFKTGTFFSAASVHDRARPDGSPLPDWAHYPAGVMWALSAAGLAVPAMQAVYLSDVPRGAGLSSSASVEMAFATAWQALGGWSCTPMELAQLGKQAENEYVGVNCGIMDQFASACGAADRLLLLDCRSLEYEHLPLPDNIALIIADTGVRRKLTGSAYNDRRAACETAVRLLQASLPGIRALRDVSPDDLARHSGMLPPEVHKRARHVVEEVARTRQAVALLQGGDLEGFGQLMNACHASLRDLYEVSIPELDVMAGLAQALPGCYGARLTGAGFGGCTVNLVAQTRARAFARDLAAGYLAATGKRANIHICRASAGAGLLKEQG